MASPFNADVVPQAPADPLFGLAAAYKEDTDAKKVDLGIGAYRDDNGKPWVLPVVKQVRSAFPTHSLKLTLL
jgi:aspartate aminotransferase, cytoplasmic